jgi:hypothetical protein
MSEIAPKQEVSQATKELENAITERLENLSSDSGETAKVEHSVERPADNQLEAIRDKINETAAKKSELADAVAVPDDTTRQQVYLDKKGALKSERQKIQANLSTGDKVFSKVIHNRAITAASDAAAATVARPTSLFWGGLFACLTSAMLYFTAKYIGFQYNYLVSFISFVGGYLVGLVVELLLRLVHGSKTTS